MNCMKRKFLGYITSQQRKKRDPIKLIKEVSLFPIKILYRIFYTEKSFKENHCPGKNSTKGGNEEKLYSFFTPLCNIFLFFFAEEKKCANFNYITRQKQRNLLFF